MSDEYKVSYSYHIGTTADDSTADNELFAFTNCDLVDLGGNGTLLLNRDNGNQAVVTPEVATALTYCTTFRTLAEHARHLVDTLPQLQGQIEEVTKVLTTIRESGLMLHASKVLGNLRGSDEENRELAPTRVCILTCDRPAALERLLDSMLHAGNLGIHDQLLLVDDSRDAGNAITNRELTARFNLTSSKDMAYLGPDEQRLMLEQLIMALPDHEHAVRWLIDRDRWASNSTYGLARTLCLLLTVDYRCIMLDDDILCRRVQAPYRRDGVSFGGGVGRELAAYASEQELMQQARFDEDGPLQGHARYLGMSLGQALPELNDTGIHEEALGDTNAAMLNSLNGNSPILVTQCGSWGDPGVPGSGWMYHLGPESIQRLVTFEGGLRQAQESRCFWLGRSRPNIAKMAVMSQATGIDNTRVLPPYFPAFRGEDYLFASMTLCLHPGSAVLDFDWCVPHLPVDRDNRPQPSANEKLLILLARHLADRVEFTSGPSLKTRLDQLIVQLRNLGEQTPENLMATIRVELAQQRAQELQGLNRQLQATGEFGSDEWTQFLQEGIRNASTALHSPKDLSDMPAVPEGVTQRDLLLQGQAMLAEFSDALEAWPAIRDAAATISRGLLSEGALVP